MIRPHGVGLYAPAGFALDPAAIDRAVTRLDRDVGARSIVDPTCRTRWQRFAAHDDERLAGVLRMAQRSARRPRDHAARRLRLDAPAAAPRLRGARARRASSGSATAISPPSSWRRSRTPAWSRSRDRWWATSARRSRRPSRFDHCFGLLDQSRYEVECALDGPDVVVRRHAVGRQPRDGRAPVRHAALSARRRRHPVPRGRRRNAVSHRAHALPAASRRRARPAAGDPARAVHRVRAVRQRRRLRSRHAAVAHLRAVCAHADLHRPAVRARAATS